MKENYNLLEAEESEIIYNLYGAKMSGASIALGDFTIYNLDLSINELISKYSAFADKHAYLQTHKSKLLLGIKVEGTDFAQSLKSADKLCETFENAFRYMLPDFAQRRRIGVLSFADWTTTNVLVCNKNGIGLRGTSNPYKLVNIDDPFFIDSSQGNDKIWILITKKNKSEIENRILNSIEWIGKAVQEKDSSKSLVQLIFAIEGMLQLSNKGELIVPSIVQHMSEWLAFIIQDNSEERIKIVKHFKKVYEKRSAVAHGRINEVSDNDLSVALQLAKLMVISFLTRKPFCEMSKMEEVRVHVEKLKFQ
jgi:hypothetical protein